MTTLAVESGARAPSRVQVLLAHVAFSARTAAEAVAHNKLRAGLTSLGILFGVASVIAMLAIGSGAEQEILEQMKLLGANNIVITPIVEQRSRSSSVRRGQTNFKRFRRSSSVVTNWRD